MHVDELDVRLLNLLDAEPRVGVLEASRRLRVARGTVQARLDKMLRSGVIRDLAPTVDPAALGYPVTAFLSLEIAQHEGRGAVVAHLERIEEVIEAHTITGSADLLVRLVARDNTDLQRVIDEVVADRSVLRAATVISLTTEIAHRTGPLVHAAAREPEAGQQRAITPRDPAGARVPSADGAPVGQPVTAGNPSARR